MVEEGNETLFDIYSENSSYDGESTTRLFLNDLGFATKVYNSKAAKGLNTYLEMNGYDEEIDHAILSGGILPEFPYLYSKNNAERMRFIGQDEDKEVEPEEERLAEIMEAIAGEDAEHYRNFRDKWLEGKLNNWELVKEYSKKQVEEIFENIDVDRIDYCWGEEDKFNLNEREELKVKELAKKSEEYIQNLEEEIDNLDELYEEEAERTKEAEKEYEAMKSLQKRVSGHLRAEDSDVGEFLEEELDGEYEEIFKNIEHERYEELREKLEQVEDVDEFRDIYNTVKNNFERKEDQLEKIKMEKKPLENSLSALERQKEQGGDITFFTKRAHISPTEAEWVYKNPKDSYTNDIQDCFPEELQDKLETHISHSAKVENVSYGNGEKEVLEEADVDIYDDIVVMHSTKFRSNTTTLYGLEEGEEEVLYKGLIEKVSNQEQRVPKLLLASHGSGGLNITRMNTAPEFKDLEGEEREDPEMTTIMTLPSFQDLDKLLEFKEKGMKNWQTKRIDKHLHASGVTMQHVLEDGSEMFEYIDNSGLIKIGEKKEELEQYEEGTEEYKEKRKELEEMCSKIVKTRAGLADNHMGDANPPGTPSNYERSERTKNYLVSNYDNLLDELIFTETVNGVLDHTDTEQEIYSNPLTDIREEGAEILKEVMKGDQINKEEVVDAFEELTEKFTESLEGTSMPNLDKQYDTAEYYISELLKGTDVSKVINISGNHPRSNKGTDEAKRLETIIRKHDREVDILNSTSSGSSHGGQGGIQDDKVIINGEKKSTGRSVGYYHKIPGGRHSSVRTKRKMLRSGYNFDEFFAGHIHKPRASFTTGMEETIFPPQQSPGPYGEKLPVKHPVYGTIVKYSNAAPENHPSNEIRWAGWHFINDDTLEREEYKGDKLDEEIEELKEKIKERSGKESN